MKALCILFGVYVCLLGGDRWIVAEPLYPIENNDNHYVNSETQETKQDVNLLSNPVDKHYVGNEVLRNNGVQNNLSFNTRRSHDGQGLHKLNKLIYAVNKTDKNPLSQSSVTTTLTANLPGLVSHNGGRYWVNENNKNTKVGYWIKPRPVWYNKIPIPENNFNPYLIPDNNLNPYLNPDKNPHPIPDIYNPHQIPDIYSPQQIPDIYNPHHIPDIYNPHHIPDIYNPYPIPDIQNPHQIPDINNPHQIPDIQTPHQIPDIYNPHQIPDIYNPHRIPDIQTPHRIPDIFNPFKIPDDYKPLPNPDNLRPYITPSFPDDSKPYHIPDENDVNPLYPIRPYDTDIDPNRIGPDVTQWNKLQCYDFNVAEIIDGLGTIVRKRNISEEAYSLKRLFRIIRVFILNNNLQDSTFSIVVSEIGKVLLNRNVEHRYLREDEIVEIVHQFKENQLDDFLYEISSHRETNLQVAVAKLARLLYNLKQTLIQKRFSRESIRLVINRVVRWSVPLVGYYFEKECKVKTQKYILQNLQEALNINLETTDWQQIGSEQEVQSQDSLGNLGAESQGYTSSENAEDLLSSGNQGSVVGLGGLGNLGGLVRPEDLAGLLKPAGLGNLGVLGGLANLNGQGNLQSYPNPTVGVLSSDDLGLNKK